MLLGNCRATRHTPAPVLPVPILRTRDSLDRMCVRLNVTVLRRPILIFHARLGPFADAECCIGPEYNGTIELHHIVPVAYLHCRARSCVWHVAGSDWPSYTASLYGRSGALCKRCGEHDIPTLMEVYRGIAMEQRNFQHLLNTDDARASLPRLESTGNGEMPSSSHFKTVGIRGHSHHSIYVFGCPYGLVQAHRISKFMCLVPST
jgi:hypothetical protein